MSEPSTETIDDEARRERFRALAREMAERPPDDEYAAESRAWQSAAWD